MADQMVAPVKTTTCRGRHVSIALPHTPQLHWRKIWGRGCVAGRCVVVFGCNCCQKGGVHGHILWRCCLWQARGECHRHPVKHVGVPLQWLWGLWFCPRRREVSHRWKVATPSYYQGRLALVFLPLDADVNKIKSATLTQPPVLREDPSCICIPHFVAMGCGIITGWWRNRSGYVLRLTGSNPSWSSLLHFYLFLEHFYSVVDSIQFHCWFEDRFSFLPLCSYILCYN